MIHAGTHRIDGLRCRSDKSTGHLSGRTRSNSSAYKSCHIHRVYILSSYLNSSGSMRIHHTFFPRHLAGINRRPILDHNLSQYCSQCHVCYNHTLIFKRFFYFFSQKNYSLKIPYFYACICALRRFRRIRTCISRS